MASQDIAQQVLEAWNMSEDDLYKHLGMASLGTRSFSESVSSMNMLMSTAANTNAAVATKSLGDSLLEKGKEFFEWSWKRIKGIVCTIYTGKTNIGDKDLATYIAGVVAAAGTVTNPLAALIITIAVKKGLDKLCAIS